MLWEARRDGATTWLLGSIHMARQDLALDAAIEAAWAASDVLVVEAEPGDPAETQKLVIELATLPPDQALHQRISAPTMEALQNALGRHGVPAQAVDRFKPWFAAMMLGLMDLQKAGFRPDGGVDQLILKRGGKPVLSLETMRGQLALFDGLPADLQEAMVNDAILSSARSVQQLHEIERAWIAGDAAALERLAIGELEAHPEFAPFYEKILFERNVTMTDAVAKLHGSGKTHFVVVGASHLVGPRGMAALLAKKGFEVHQVAARGAVPAGGTIAAR